MEKEGKTLELSVSRLQEAIEYFTPNSLSRATHAIKEDEKAEQNTIIEHLKETRDILNEMQKLLLEDAQKPIEKNVAANADNRGNNGEYRQSPGTQSPLSSSSSSTPQSPSSSPSSPQSPPRSMATNVPKSMSALSMFASKQADCNVNINAVESEEPDGIFSQSSSF